MKNVMLKKITGLTAAVLMAAAVMSMGAMAEEEYVENEWGFVDGSMDVSNGIPDNAQGRLAKIKEAGKLTVATEPYFAPQEFIDPSLTGQDQYVGADMEFAKLIAERMGVELEIVPLEFTAVQASVAEGKYDLAISALAYTPGRAGAMELSKGYHLSGESSLYGIIIRNEDAENIKSVDDLADRTIITQSGSLQEALANENIPKYKEFKRVSSMQDAFLAVQEGKADAAVIDRENAMLYIQNNPGCDMMVVDEIAFKLDEVYDGTRVGTEKGEIQLMYFVNGVIDEMLEQGLYEKWFEEYAEYAGKLGVE